MNSSVSTLATTIGNSISISRRARKIKQADLAEMAGIGMNTMVGIEKGITTVQLGHYLSVLDALGITDILNPIKMMTADTTGIESMTTFLPKRVIGNRKKRKSIQSYSDFE